VSKALQSRLDLSEPTFDQLSLFDEVDGAEGNAEATRATAAPNAQVLGANDEVAEADGADPQAQNEISSVPIYPNSRRQRERARCCKCGCTIRHAMAFSRLACRDCYGTQYYEDRVSYLALLADLNRPFIGTGRGAKSKIKPLSIPGKAKAAPEPLDPFEAMDEEISVDRAQVEEETRRYNQLLAWMSMVGSGSLHVLRNTCRELGLEADSQETSSRQVPRILRRLRLLGHAESSPDGSRWSVAPPVLVSAAWRESEDEYFLCGARDQVLVDALKKKARAEEMPQHSGDAPPRVQLWADDPQQLTAGLQKEGVVVPLRAVGNIAVLLAERLPPLDVWLSLLESLRGLHPEQFDLEKFSEGAWEHTHWKQASGFYQMWEPQAQRPPGSRPKYRLFYDAPSQTWRRGDWYGLRFLAQHAGGNRCPVHHQAHQGLLAVPEQWRWPELYERALVLASGQLPTFLTQKGARWFLYKKVSRTLLDHLTNKLSLNVISS
jgi:hypothetical protein